MPADCGLHALAARVGRVTAARRDPDPQPRPAPTLPSPGLPLPPELQLRRQLSFSEDSDLSSDDVLESASQRSKREVCRRVGSCGGWGWGPSVAQDQGCCPPSRARGAGRASPGGAAGDAAGRARASQGAARAPAPVAGVSGFSSGKTGVPGRGAGPDGPSAFGRRCALPLQSSVPSRAALPGQRRGCLCPGPREAVRTWPSWSPSSSPGDVLPLLNGKPPRTLCPFFTTLPRTWPCLPERLRQGCGPLPLLAWPRSSPALQQTRGSQSSRCHLIPDVFIPWTMPACICLFS